jgi:magnesium-transporting ATPase (P-type)
VLVQELPAVEGLARVDVLCIDKTGTLTEGKLAVERVEPFDDADRTDALDALAALAAADLTPNATMQAVREHVPTSPPDWAVTETVPFSSARKWSAVAFRDRGAWVLGAPDVVLATARAADGVRRLLERDAASGARVLVLCRASVDLAGETLPDALEPVAAVVLADRPRPDASRTLGYFAAQGVAVKVISGDHPATVGSIAAALGLAGADAPVDARALPDDEAQLAAVMEEASVFGRVTPQQKRAMVRALRSRGHVVAMTGDGVNDALALKDADIGVAMGSGSDATRAVAQLVLLDSEFDALPPVVAEGRRVLGNIERTSSLYLTKTVYAMLLALAVGVAGFVFPFLPRHLTLIGSLTIGIPSFFLALAPNTERFRPGFVRRVMRFAAPAGFLAATATFLAYYVAGTEPGITLLEEQTTAVIVLTFVGFAVLTIVASPLTPLRLGLIWAMVALFVLALVWPVSQEFFALDPPPLVVWLAGLGIAGLTWSFARVFVPGEQPVGPGGR